MSQVASIIFIVVAVVLFFVYSRWQKFHDVHDTIVTEEPYNWDKTHSTILKFNEGMVERGKEWKIHQEKKVAMGNIVNIGQKYLKMVEDKTVGIKTEPIQMYKYYKECGCYYGYAGRATRTSRCDSKYECEYRTSKGSKHNIKCLPNRGTPFINPNPNVRKLTVSQARDIWGEGYANVCPGAST